MDLSLKVSSLSTESNSESYTTRKIFATLDGNRPFDDSYPPRSLRLLMPHYLVDVDFLGSHWTRSLEAKSVLISHLTSSLEVKNISNGVTPRVSVAWATEQGKNRRARLCQVTLQAERSGLWAGGPSRDSVAWLRSSRGKLGARLGF